MHIVLHNIIERKAVRDWLTLATEAEVEMTVEMEGSLRSGMNHENGDARILTF